MNEETSQRARNLVRQQLGGMAAQKATDEFCLYTAGFFPVSSRSYDSASEAFAFSGTSRRPSIIEFRTAPPQENPGSTGRSGIGKELREVLKKITRQERELFDINQVVRQTRIKAYRENAITNIQHFNDFLERNIEREFAHGSDSLRQQPYLTKMCWLNQTVKTIADPRLLAELAGDPEVTALDVPRTLSREINETGEILHAPQYRRKFSATGRGIVVAVIDSEVALKHNAFGTRVMHRSNYTREPWGNPDSHGTGVAGIIGSGDAGFSGMAPDATIYNYKVLATNPSLDADDFQASLAIQKALEDGAHLANCSWGAGPARDGHGREARACDAAWNLGLTIIKSAGNNGPGPGTLTAPADANGIIVVGATGKNGKKVELYSSRGPLPSGEHRPHLVAPGGGSGGGISSCLPGGGFADIGAGTSFAAPHVTGLLALILEGDQSLSPEEQRDLLLKLCTKLPGFTIDDQGSGIISMASLLKSQSVPG